VPQQELPALAVAGFIHDEASGSMAIVNDKLVREGEEVSPGLILEKASADGLIFNYNGRRFKR
jgi:general secretion pathway protein B